MPNNSNQTPNELSSQPRKSNIDYPKHETAQDQADYMKLVEDYPNEVAQRWAMLRGEPLPLPSKKEGQ